MARLLLHIGGHKTGTTYLQNLFHENRARLAQAGLHYPDIGPNTAHHVLASPWLTLKDVPDSFYGPRGPQGLWDDFLAKYADIDGTVILSGENFSRCHPETVDMADLAQRLSVFEEVHVIYVMRAQAELIQSLWLQVRKSNRNVGLYNYVRNAIEQRRALGVWIDPNAVYDMLLAGFAPEQISFFDHGALRSAPGGLPQLILDECGTGLRVADLVQPEEANISPDPLSYWIASEVVGPSRTPHPILVEAIRARLRATGRHNTLLARHEHVKITTRYSAANAKLVERLRPHQPDFTFEEPAVPDDMIYREEIPDTVWLQIAQAIHAHAAEAALAEASPKARLASARARVGQLLRDTGLR